MRNAVLPLGCAALVLVAAPVRGAGADAPTFNKDVAPILFQKCASCHRPNSVGPFPLLTYQDARKRAKQSANVVLGGRPVNPWDELGAWAAVIGHSLEVQGRKKT